MSTCTCKKYNELIFFYYVLTRRRKRLKPTVRVTYHFENEVKRTRVEQIRSEKSVEEGDRQEEDLQVLSIPQPNDNGETPDSRHYQRLKKAEEMWSKHRELSLTSFFESEGFMFSERGKRCYYCNEEACCRCYDCSATLTLCKACAIEKHSVINIFHHVEILKVIFF